MDTTAENEPVDATRAAGGVVSAHGVTRRFGEGDTAVDALRGVTLGIPKGQFTAVMGPSGSGKSTLMHILAGLDRPTTGEVSIDGTDITRMGDQELTLLRRNHIGFIFQFFNLLPMLTAAENITLPLDLAGTKPDKAWVEEVVAKVGLGDRRAHRPSELSGGQQQRVAIARALISKPTVLFADEPTGNLDSTTGEEILHLLRDSVDTYGQTTLMVTHEPRAAAMADRILFLADGLIVRDAGKSTASEVLAAMNELPAMIGVSLKGLAGRKLRATLTALAIVLGVAMISGTYVLTDTIEKAFDSLFVEAYAGTDVVVTGKGAFETDFGMPPSFDEELLADVKALPGVEAAVGGISDFAQLTDKEGDLISTQGAPALAFGIDSSEERFNALRLTDGGWPSGPGEVVIDAGTADQEEYRVGDAIGVAAKGPVTEFRITGIAKFGSVDSIGSATFAVFDIPTAQALFDKPGQLDGIQTAAKEGVAPEQLVDEIRPILPGGTEVQTADQEAKDATKDVEDFTKFIRYFLLAFGGIALFVGAFVIFNTLSITVAQRVREFATLRTIGASRRQVLGSVILEALVIGLVASVVGLFLGLGLAKGLNSILVSFGLDLPTAGIVFAGRTIVVSLVAGVVITLAAGILPAVRATRVPPIAAVREGATLPRSRFARFTPYVAAITTVLGLALLLYGMFVDNIGIGQRLGGIGAGCLILFVGVAGFSERLVRPLASVLGWPAVRVGGAAGKLARENAMRNPHRTAATAAALMIGLALITFVAVLAQGLRDSVGDAIGRQVNADYVVVSDDNFTPFEPASDAALASVPGTEVVGIRGDRGRANGREENVTGVDAAAIASVYDFDWIEGSDAVLASLDDGGAIVEKSFAEDEVLSVGSPLRIETPNGEQLSVEVKGIYKAPPFWEMLGNVSISREAFDASFQDPRNLYTFISVPGGATAGSEQALEAALADFPGVKLDTKGGFSKSQQDSIGPFLNLLYVLLALSVIVSLFGIVNTLVLSVFERTRELGMLRAVGMTRRQVRRMIRHESVITAMIGAVLGMVLGIFLAVLVTQALKDEGVIFSVPVGNLVIFAAIAVVAGMAAAIFPARRAARLNVLEALQYE